MRMRGVRVLPILKRGSVIYRKGLVLRFEFRSYEAFEIAGIKSSMMSRLSVAGYNFTSRKMIFYL